MPPEPTSEIFEIHDVAPGQVYSVVLNGVFTMSYPRKTIFSEEVEIHTSTLPRWKPRITLDRRTLESEDE